MCKYTLFGPHHFNYLLWFSLINYDLFIYYQANKNNYWFFILITTRWASTFRSYFCNWHALEWYHEWIYIIIWIYIIMWTFYRIFTNMTDTIYRMNVWMKRQRSCDIDSLFAQLLWEQNTREACKQHRSAYKGSSSGQRAAAGSDIAGLNIAVVSYFYLEARTLL